MGIRTKHKKNMETVARWLSDNPNADIDYDFFSNIDEEDPSSLDNHTIGNPIGWAAAILGRQGGDNFIQFSQDELGIDPSDDVWYFLAERMTEDGNFMQLPSWMTVAEFVALQFDWISGGKSIAEFLEEMDL